jgi:hypothetical protein
MKTLIVLVSALLMTSAGAGVCWKKGETQNKESALINIDYSENHGYFFTVKSFGDVGIETYDIAEVQNAMGEVVHNSCHTDHDVESCVLSLNHAHADYSYYAYDVNMTAKLDLIKKVKETKIFMGQMHVELRGDYDSYYYGPEFKTIDIVCKF